MYYLVGMRSLTQAGTAQRLLRQSGVQAQVVKMPVSLSAGGCANALRLTDLNRARAGLQKNGIAGGKTFFTRDGVRFSEL